MNCPHCQRVIYSRQHSRCGFCGTALPSDLLLPLHEVDQMKAEMLEIEARRQKAKAKEDKEREAIRRRNNHWQISSFTGMP